MIDITTLGARCAGLAPGLVLKRAIARLDELDDHLLRDIGLTRADIANCRGPSPVPCAIRKLNALED